MLQYASATAAFTVLCALSYTEDNTHKPISQNQYLIYYDALSFGKILVSPWRIPAEIPAGIDYFPLAPSLRVAGSPHLVLSHRIFLNNLSASVGILGRPNSRSLAAGASPGTPKHINKGARRDAG